MKISNFFLVLILLLVDAKDGYGLSAGSSEDSAESSAIDTEGVSQIRNHLKEADKLQDLTDKDRRQKEEEIFDKELNQLLEQNPKDTENDGKKSKIVKKEKTGFKKSKSRKSKKGKKKNRKNSKNKVKSENRKNNVKTKNEKIKQDMSKHKFSKKHTKKRSKSKDNRKNKSKIVKIKKGNNRKKESGQSKKKVKNDVRYKQNTSVNEKKSRKGKYNHKKNKVSTKESRNLDEENDVNGNNKKAVRKRCPKPRGKCKNSNGKCKKQCSGKELELSVRGCTGKLCKCCAKPKCKTAKKCKKLGGKCKKKCNKKEEEIRKGCKGPNCILKCCVKKCKPSNTCKDRGGTCIAKKKKCDGEIIIGECTRKGAPNQEKNKCHCCAPKISDRTSSATKTTSPTTLPATKSSITPIFITTAAPTTKETSNSQEPSTTIVPTTVNPTSKTPIVITTASPTAKETSNSQEPSTTIVPTTVNPKEASTARLSTTITEAITSEVPTTQEALTTKDTTTISLITTTRPPTTTSTSNNNVVSTRQEASTTKEYTTTSLIPTEEQASTSRESTTTEDSTTTEYTKPIDPITDDRLIISVEEFISIYNKTYENEEEAEKRVAIFKENIKTIENHNKLYQSGNSSYQMAVNKFSDITYDEFVLYHTGLNESDHDTRRSHSNTYVPMNLGQEPASMDYRDMGAVNPVRDQSRGGTSRCGSCWAHAAVSSIESQILLKRGILPQLSEQYLVDCSNGGGCSGGHPSKAFDYVKANGIAYTNDYPYTAKDERCKRDVHKTSYKVSALKWISSKSDENLLNAVVHVGPVAVGIHTPRGYVHYKNGIFEDRGCENNPTENHAVTLIGYGEENGKKYWLIRDSYGSNKRENGYIKIYRNKRNYCSISINALVPVVEDPCTSLGGQSVSGQCIRIYDEPKTWNQAVSSCRAKGQQLISLQNPVVFSAYMKSNHDGKVWWVGGSDQNREGTWKWVNGASLGHFPWPSGEPNDGGGNEDCLSWGYRSNYNDAPCSSSRGYICELDHCLSIGGKTIGGQCIIFNTNPKTWSQSVTECESKGQRLAVPQDPHAVKTYVRNLQDNKNYWIGGSDRNREGTWTWINGRSLGNNFPWSSGEPNNWNRDEDCLEISRSGDYNDNNCNKAFGYLCEPGGLQGYYGLPSPNDGCPSPASQWLKGGRYHDTEDSRNKNGVSNPNNLQAFIREPGIKIDFCLKKYPEGSPWPAGTYCIYRFRNECPQGFTSGWIHWDDEDSRNANDHWGTLPFGRYDRNTKYEYCCRSDRDHNTAIHLPFGKTFVLFPYGSDCQKVIGMRSSKQWIYWDNEDDSTDTSRGGTYPKLDIDSGGNYKLYFCYYFE